MDESVDGTMDGSIQQMDQRIDGSRAGSIEQWMDQNYRTGEFEAIFDCWLKATKKSQNDTC